MIDDSHSTVQAESDALCDNGYTPARLSHVTLVVKLWNSFKPNLTSDSTVHIPAVSFMWCTLQYCFLVIKRVGH